MKAPSLLVFQERTNSKTGEVTYHHQMLGAALVHPDLKQVIPLAPEAIIKQDGENKNDCERNASKRLLQKIRDEHPHKKLIVVEDGLASNAPHIRLLKRLNMRSILGAKPDDHEHLFGEVAQAEAAGRATTLRWTDGSILKRFSWVTDLTITPNNARHLVRGGRSRWKIENETKRSTRSRIRAINSGTTLVMARRICRRTSRC